MCMFKRLATTTRHSCKLPYTTHDWCVWRHHFQKNDSFSIKMCTCFSIHSRRKSISGNWKTNQGSAMVIYFFNIRHIEFLLIFTLHSCLQLEQIAMTEKYKSWINDVSVNLHISTSTKIVDDCFSHTFFVRRRRRLRRHECGELIVYSANADSRYAKSCTHILRIPSAKSNFRIRRVWAHERATWNWMMSFLVDRHIVWVWVNYLVGDVVKQ